MNEPSMPRATLLGRLALIGLSVTALGASFLWVGGWLTPQRLTPSDFIDRFEASGGVHPGYRRAHAKGLCISGYFASNGQAARLSTAALFAEGRVPVMGRLSIAGSNPQAADTGGPVRSMALLLQQADGQQWRTAMNNPPMLAVGTPQEFLEQLQAMAPDPATGKPDPARIQAFFAQHPESAAFRQWAASYQPSSSFASTTYHSINAFHLIDANGQTQAVRWAMVPQLTPVPFTSPPSDPQVLQTELLQRLKQGPLRWDLLLTLAEKDDVVDRATQPWPAERRQVKAGTLVIEQAEVQLQGACRDVNFDPLILPVGIEPSADPILRVRSAAYAESFKRRARDGAPHAATGARP